MVFYFIYVSNMSKGRYSSNFLHGIFGKQVTTFFFTFMEVSVDK